MSVSVEATCRRTTAAVTVLVAALLAIACGLAAASFPGTNGRIAFTRFVAGSIAIVSVNPDGSDLRQLTSPAFAVEDDVPAWAPDGSAIVFQRCVKNVCHLWQMAADGSGQHQLGPTTGLPQGDFEAQAGYAPDGNRIVLQHGYGRRSNGLFKVQGLFTMRSDGTGLRQLTERGVRFPAFADFKPTWAPNGKSIMFVHERTGCGTACTGALYSVRPDGSGLKKVTGFGDYSAARWSPDSRTVAIRYAATGHQRQIYTMHPDGTGRRQITHFPTGTEVATPDFSPDGKLIVVGFGTNGLKPDLYVMNTDGSNPQPLTSGHQFDSASVWGPA